MDLGNGFFAEMLSEGYALIQICDQSAKTIYRGPSLQDILAEYRLRMDSEIERKIREIP